MQTLSNCTVGVLWVQPTPYFSSYVPFCIIPADKRSQLGLSLCYHKLSFPSVFWPRRSFLRLISFCLLSRNISCGLPNFTCSHHKNNSGDSNCPLERQLDKYIRGCACTFKNFLKRFAHAEVYLNLITTAEIHVMKALLSLWVCSTTLLGLAMYKQDGWAVLFTL